MSRDLDDIVLLKISCDQGAFIICDSVLRDDVAVSAAFGKNKDTGKCDTFHSSRDVFKLLSF